MQLSEDIDHNLAWLTTAEVGELSKERALVVQPLGSIEQHGSHLACITDVLIAERLVNIAVGRVDEGLEVWMLPALSYGKSNEHLGMAGTVSLSAETLAAVCMDIGRSIAASGFRKLVFVNGHGGQPGLLETVSRDIRLETGLQVFSIFLGRLGFPEDVSNELIDAGWGIHAGQAETSIVMVLDSRAVRSDLLAPDGLGARDLFASLKHLTLEGAVPTSWKTRDMSQTGTIGDPRQASKDMGSRIVDFWASNLAAAFKEISDFEFSTEL